MVSHFESNVTALLRHWLDPSAVVSRLRQPRNPNGSASKANAINGSTPNDKYRIMLRNAGTASRETTPAAPECSYPKYTAALTPKIVIPRRTYTALRAANCQFLDRFIMCGESVSCLTLAKAKHHEQFDPSNEHKGQRREPAADDVPFVSERIGWLPFPAPSCWPDVEG
jgi:hypothetical protein